MIRAFARILRLMDRLEQPVVAYDDTQMWPVGLLGHLVAMRVLREIEPAQWVRCTSCEEGHMLEPDIRQYPEANRTIGVARCPECGRVEIDLDRLKCWVPNFDGLASLLAAELELDASPTSLVHARIGFLGSTTTPGGMLDVFLARGLTWQDAATVIERAHRLTASQAPVVLVPHILPPASFWSLIRPTMLTVDEHARWNAKAPRPDFGSLSAALRKLCPPVPEERWLRVNECAKRLSKILLGIDYKKAMSRVSDAATRGKFRTNGKKGIDRRIDRDSFSVWLNEQHERDLDATDY